MNPEFIVGNWVDFFVPDYEVRLQDCLQGYVDARADAEEWHSLTKKEQRAELEGIAAEFDKAYHGMYQVYKCSALNMARPAR